jgi:hypothetical protein
MQNWKGRGENEENLICKEMTRIAVEFQKGVLK